MTCIREQEIQVSCLELIPSINWLRFDLLTRNEKRKLDINQINRVAVVRRYKLFDFVELTDFAFLLSFHKVYKYHDFDLTFFYIQLYYFNMITPDFILQDLYDGENTTMTGVYVRQERTSLQST